MDFKGANLCTLLWGKRCHKCLLRRWHRFIGFVKFGLRLILTVTCKAGHFVSALLGKEYSLSGIGEPMGTKRMIE